MILQKSTRKNKKWMINGVHFGQQGADDYTIHKDDKRKENYLKRHEKRENWNDLNTAGFWSRWLLWNKPTIEQSIRDVEKRFGVKIEN